jgi:hypothetical protein
MAGKKGQKNRFWSDDEKGLICAQTRMADVSVAHGCQAVNGGVKTCHWGGAKVGHLEPRLGA